LRSTIDGFKIQSLAIAGLSREQRRTGRVVKHNRMLLSARYIRGDGIEIGGLGRTLQVLRSARVKYLDRYSKENLFSNYPEMKGKHIVEPDIVDDGETLSTVKEGSQDFLIANHVIEHFQNPILFFRNAERVLRPGGVLFFALPDKEKTFDRNRPITPFSHLIDDYDNGPAKTKLEHYREFVRLAETHNGTQAWSTEAEYQALVAKLMAEDYSIHFHVWDAAAIVEMIVLLRSACQLRFQPLAIVASGDEVVCVLQRM
jgi:predicted SAM-dependent methyltransferase